MKSLIKKYYYKLILILVCSITLYLSYIKYSNRYIFRKKLILNDYFWSQNNKLETKINFKKKGIYNIFLKLKYNEKYPYYNIFLKYIIKDKNNNIIKDEIIEYQILDKITGKPLGKGFWKSKNIYLLLVNKMEFPENAEYNITVEQMMRKKELIGIEKIALEVYLI